MMTTLRPHTYAILTPAQLTPRRIAELSGRELDAQIAWHVFGRPLTPATQHWHASIASAVSLCLYCGIDASKSNPIPALIARECLRQHLRRTWPQIHRSTAHAA